MTLYTSQLKENEVDPKKGPTSFFISYLTLIYPVINS